MEIDKRLKSKEWRLANLYRIVDKNSKLIKFNKNEVQEQLDLEKSRRNIILKGRQQGITTYECIDGLDDVLFKMNFKMVIIAHDKDSLIKIFEKIKIAWDHFPKPLKEAMGYEAKTDRVNELSFNNGSSIRVTLSCRSDTVNRLHISEFGKICAKYPLKAQEIITGAIPAVPAEGRIDIESTAEGEFGAFADMFWEAWERGEPQVPKQFKAFFFSWTLSQEYKLNATLDIPPDLKEYQKLHNLTQEQINWYFIERQTQKKFMPQEYPTTPEEAFISSGNKMFDQDILAKHKINLETGIPINDWVLYRPYTSSHRYVIGADIAEGVGQDSSTAIILDLTTNEEVAKYKSNKIPPDLFAHELHTWSMRYGFALIAPERNNHGHTTISVLRGLNANIFEEKTIAKKEETNTKRLGWHTNGASKPKMMYELSDAINEMQITIHSKDLLRELQTYDKNDLNVIKFDDEQTKHWDLVIALAIAWQMRLYAPKMAYSTSSSMDIDEWN